MRILFENGQRDIFAPLKLYQLPENFGDEFYTSSVKYDE